MELFGELLIILQALARPNSGIQAKFIVCILLMEHADESGAAESGEQLLLVQRWKLVVIKQHLKEINFTDRGKHVIANTVVQLARGT